MIHIFAIIGIAMIVMLPISLGITIFAPMRTRDKLKTFFALPFGFIVAMILIVIGWGDWPDLPAGDYSGLIFKGIFGLGGLGLILGVVMRIKGVWAGGYSAPPYQPGPHK